MTLVINIDPKQIDLEKIQQAATYLREGKIGAFPTETVYGLGANALDRNAVERVFLAKGRPFQDPLIVHISSLTMVRDVVQYVPDTAYSLMERFWPGALTLVLPRSSGIPAEVSAGLDTVAIRMPANPIALTLIEHAGIPIAAPSANRFGHTSPTTAAHVLADLGDKIDFLIAGGESNVGVESTVLDLTHQPPLILRPGGVSQEQLTKAIGEVVLRDDHSVQDQKDPMPSPGMLSRHYAPLTTLVLIESENAKNASQRLIVEAKLLLESGKKVAVLSADDDADFYKGLNVIIEKIGSSQNLDQIANRLYAAIRFLDEQNVDFILVRSFGKDGLGLAILDRLRRAASTIIKVD